MPDLLLLILSVLSSLFSTRVEAGSCIAYSPGELVTRLQAPMVQESSGVVASRVHDGLWYTHNDSGGKPVLYAFTLDGVLRGIYPVRGASAIDWEDIAAGPCPISRDSCLYIGDIGDNARERHFITVYAVEEPKTEGQQTIEVLAAWRAYYPDGPRNSEALLVQPFSGAIYLVTKEKHGHSEVFRFPSAPSERPAVLELVANINLPGSSKAARKVTGGDWSMDGSRVVLRTYHRVWEWKAHLDDPERHWKEPASAWSTPREPQGEAIAYSPAGDLLTTSEGSPMPVSLIPCVLAPGGIGY